MKLSDINPESFEVREEGFTFENISAISPEIAQNLRSKSVIILPSHGTSNSFYCGSLDILDFLIENGIDTEICSTDENYKELSLNGDDIWIGQFFITLIAIPIFCGVISSYIYEKLKPKKDDTLHVKFIIEKADGTTESVSYDGPIEKFDSVIHTVRKHNVQN